MENIKRINLLSEAELTDLYARPVFNSDEQELYFTLTEQEQIILDFYKDLNTKVYFILQLGYFKAKQQFFKFDFSEISNDLQFITKTYFRGTKIVLSGLLSRDYIAKQKQDILGLFDYHDWSSKYEVQIETQLCEILRYYPKSHNALRQLLNYFDDKQIIIPNYRKLQDIFTAAFRLEEKRLSQIILSIPESKSKQEQLSALIKNDDGISQLNIVRADQKDLQFTAVRTEVEKAQGLVDLYEFSKVFTPTLKLSKNAVRYYADVVEQYAPFRLKQLNKAQQWLHLICFVYHRYQQIMDNLIISFMYHTRAILDAGKTYAAMAQDALWMLDNAWSITTENISLGCNKGFNIKETKEGKQEWSLLYDSSEKLNDAFFRKLPKVEIADMLMFIDDIIRLCDNFEHMKDRYIKRKKPIPLAINACLLAEAFGFSIEKMAEMSDLTVDLLQSTREDFIRVETLCKINDMVSNLIKSLPIFKEWDLLENKVLADADGQKFPTNNKTIQSRFSKKYLGKGRGISLYTLVANFVAVNAKNIGLNEYEGHSLYDMIYNNKTDIEIDMVTGDNHSVNKLNFVALDSIDVDYVPSIKNIRSAADDLYSIKSPDSYTGHIIPKDTIKICRIKSQKRGILRVLLSLIMQENTQSNIIRKLSSHARYARLKAGLFEYNKIFKSTHMLNLIDDMRLRKVIRTARNRTEAYHQLQSRIRKLYNGIFKGYKVVDNRVSAHAARLIANCIIAYNSIILNTVYEKMIKDGVAQNIIDEFTRISPIAWIHILFTGRYAFKKSNGNIDIEAMAQVLEQHFKTISC